MRKMGWKRRRFGRVDREMDFLLKFESLDEDFAKVCDLLKIKAGPLDKHNVSKRKPYWEYYDDELVEMVRRRFLEEIEVGGYDFCGNQCQSFDRKYFAK
jgi:hypothetical protein